MEELKEELIQARIILTAVLLKYADKAPDSNTYKVTLQPVHNDPSLMTYRIAVFSGEEATTLIMAEQTKCPTPPEGWWCSREAGHEGPCAARPLNLKGTDNV